MLGLPTRKDGLQGRPPTACKPGRSGRIHDDPFLQLGFFVVDVQAAQGHDDGFALFVPLAREKPAWRFQQKDHANNHDQSKEDLEGDGKTPGEICGAVTAAIIDPIRDEGAESDDAAFNADEEAAVGRSRAFGLVRGDCGRIDAVAEACDGPPNDELGERVRIGLRSDLNDDAEDHDGATDHHRAAASEEVAERENEDRSKEAA